MDHTSGVIDPERPWIRDERDDPARMKWMQTLFNPLGRSPKLHFTRAWTAMFMGRVLLYIGPSLTAGIAGMAGAGTSGLSAPVDLLLFSVPALLVPFVLFVLVTEYTSFCAHARRLTDAGKPVILAILVLLPLLLGLMAYAAGTQMGAAGFRQAQDKAAAAASAPASADGAATADALAASPPARGGQGGRPDAAPKSERQAALSAGMGFALPIWALGSFAAMLWTLLYVARLPNEGIGRKRTGSDLTAEEAAQGL